MGSVMSMIECPVCKCEANEDFYYETSKDYVICMNCGYQKSVTIKNRNKKLNELTDDDWEIKELLSPYGAYRVKIYNSIGWTCGSFEDVDDYALFKQRAQTDESTEFASVSRLIDGKIVEEIIVDNGPRFDGAGFSIEDRELNEGRVV